MQSKDDKNKYLGLSAAVNRGWFPGGLLEKLPFAYNISEQCKMFHDGLSFSKASVVICVERSRNRSFRKF